MTDTTVYTIFAGMIPTLGFAKEDFTVDRKGNIGKNKVRGGSLSLGTSISERGRSRKATVRGSVAWYEFSTTVRAIHKEMLGGNKGSDAQDLRWPKGWKEKFTTGNVSSGNLASKFVNQIDEDILKPTGEKVKGRSGTASEQDVTFDRGREKTEGEVKGHDDAELRKQGNLVNKANAVDIYVRGMDDKIYRLDVTSMTMSDELEHHGLGSLEGRKDAGVDSKAILKDIQGENTEAAEKRLLTYFQGRTKEYNNVIKGLKQQLNEMSGGENLYLKNLNLDDTNQLEDIRRDLENNMKKAPQGDAGPHTLQKLRPDLKKSMALLRKQGRDKMQGSVVRDGFKSAVQFALHALGTVVQSRNTITEYRIDSSYTIGVQNRINASGAQVLEFMQLKQADVRIRHEAALQHYYIRREVGNIFNNFGQEIIDKTSIDSNFAHAAYSVAQDGSAVEIGALQTTSYGNIARSAHNLHLGASSVISSQDFNDRIEEWIDEVGTGKGWKGRIHNFLQNHIEEGPEIALPKKAPSFIRHQIGADSMLAPPGTLTGKSRKYWGLGEYLTKDNKDNFQDAVGARWWAAPYISLLYPSGQVGSR